MAGAPLGVADPVTLIRGARVFDRDLDVHKPPARDVIIEGNRVASVTPSGEIGDRKIRIAEAAQRKSSNARLIDAEGKMLIPGLINSHYHSYDVLSKGRFEDMPFDVWFLHSQPAFWGKRSKAELRARTLLGAMECLRHGITTIQDMNTVVPQDEETLDIILGAYAETGIRVVFSIAVRDVAALDIAPFLPRDVPAQVSAVITGKAGDAQEDVAFVEAQIKRIDPLPPRLHWALSPSGPQRCSTPLLEGIARLSDLYKLPIFTHVYETRAQLAKARAHYPDHGGSLVRYMADLGLLTARTTLAHSIYITDDEIEHVARAGAGVVHNPLANLKLKNGVAPLLNIKRAGINLALGCDNCSCSDCQNLFQAMKLFTLLAAGMDAEPTGVLAQDALLAATIGGARALGLAGIIGEVRPGMLADLTLIDLSDLAYLPFNSAARQLVFSETGRGVHTVMVDGEVVLEAGRMTRIDENAFRHELDEVMQVVDRDYEQLVARQRSAVPLLLEANRNLMKAKLGLRRLVSESGG